VRASAAASRQAAPIDDRHLDWNGCFSVRDDEVAGGDAAPRPDGVATVRVPLDAVEDTKRSARPLRARHAALGSADDRPVLDAFLAERGTTAEALVVDLRKGRELEALLRDRGGLAHDDLAALRARVLA
jgi:hypothetical protein